MPDQFGRNSIDGKEQAQPDLESNLDLYLPGSLRFGPRIPHYYGDAVRKFFMVIAGALLLMAPVLGSYQPWFLPFQIFGSVVLVCLAALTNPKKSWIMIANALVAGTGLVMFELIALTAYFEDETFMFLLTEAIAVMFLFSLYFSVKTVRAMILGTLGKRSTTGEFLTYDKDARIRHVRSFTDSGD